MKSVSFRTYRPGDEALIVELWNQCAVCDPVTPLRFRNLVLLDANFDPAGVRLAFDGERLVGCVYAVRRLLPMTGNDLEPDNGWIPFFFVDSAYERQGIGSALLREAEAFLREAGRKQLFFSAYAPNYIVPGIDAAAYPKGDAFLRRNGFSTRYTAVAMDRSLVGYIVPEEVRELKRQRIAEGYRFPTASDANLVDLLRFAGERFNPDWARAIREGLLSGQPIDRIKLAVHGDAIVGFCLNGAYEGVPERFGPFGVDPARRGLGLGKILLHEALASMRAQSLHGAWFLWTGEQSPAGHLYKQAGFRITRSFDIMSKPIA